MSTHESVIGLEWLSNTLSADAMLLAAAPGGVHRGLAPPDSQTPYVIVIQQAATDVTSMNEFRLFVEVLYQVKAVGPANNTGGIASAANRIDQLLGNPPITGDTTDGHILACWRQEPLQLDDLHADGTMDTHIGGLYHLQIEQKS